MVAKRNELPFLLGIVVLGLLPLNSAGFISLQDHGAGQVQQAPLPDVAPTEHPVFAQPPTPTPVRPRILNVTPAGVVLLGQTVSVVGRAEEGGVVEVLIDGRSVITVSANAQGIWQTSISFPNSGSYTLRARLLLKDYVLEDWHPATVVVATPTPTASDTPAPTVTNTLVPPDTPTPATARCHTKAALNVRQGPGTNYLVIGSTQQGEVVLPTARSRDGGWVYSPEVGERGGWVSASPQYLECNGLVDSLPIGAAPPAPATPTSVPPTPVPPTLTPTNTLASIETPTETPKPTDMPTINPSGSSNESGGNNDPVINN